MSNILILYLLVSLASYLLGIAIGIVFEKTRHSHRLWRSSQSKSKGVFNEDTFFVDPKDVVESYKQSSNVTEFINKIK